MILATKEFMRDLSILFDPDTDGHERMIANRRIKDTFETMRDRIKELELPDGLNDDDWTPVGTDYEMKSFVRPRKK